MSKTVYHRELALISANGGKKAFVYLSFLVMYGVPSKKGGLPLFFHVKANSYILSPRTGVNAIYPLYPLDKVIQNKLDLP
jgi:hypothetical protein